LGELRSGLQLEGDGLIAGEVRREPLRRVGPGSDASSSHRVPHRSAERTGDSAAESARGLRCQLHCRARSGSGSALSHPHTGSDRGAAGGSNHAQPRLHRCSGACMLQRQAACFWDALQQSRQCGPEQAVRSLGSWMHVQPSGAWPQPSRLPAQRCCPADMHRARGCRAADELSGAACRAA